MTSASDNPVPRRQFRDFSWKDTNLRIASDRFEVLTAAIRRQRALLESYIARYPLFLESMVPIPPRPDAPEVARRMHRAAFAVGVGPMAAVAGTLAQMAAEAVLAAGGREAVVENGGDTYAVSPAPVSIGLYAGPGRLGTRLALMLEVADMPLAVCSSSSRMGHSHSFGCCDLATVVSADASLADAAATLACNRVKREADLEPTATAIAAIPDVRGVLLVKNDRVAMAGKLPALVRNRDPRLSAKITRDARNRASFPPVAAAEDESRPSRGPEI